MDVALPWDGEDLLLTWEHGPVSLVSELAGAASIVSAAVEPPKTTLAARQLGKDALLLWDSHGFLGLRTAWHDRQPRRALHWGGGQQAETDRAHSLRCQLSLADYLEAGYSAL